ncbi:TonB-dependent receptor [Flagellimonas zhangzhouensis]|uniref:Outer membrane receptor for ferrienterochelin and colicins n=1 Tax=Flagellimonas zhangzhouensis TaxID=1073328 RepID=A0A1H2Q886_9FLAO|nr:carboxypeptidase-like regulatory domain-containing protein [Allomuricauda zhangzhouensis]SDQ49979.1 Outer membrane receptor for ferrienterochelin and colicins [Allomuricauda zhangzhouensis]SDW03393.1 Outer membrane receptor for ferrienterochelin and colicins [Allomuricauda zhangzhouensis]
MLETHPNKYAGLLIGFLFFLFCSFWIQAQEKQQTSIDLISHIKELETTYSIKFSYLNKDVGGLQITLPDSLNTLQKHLDFLDLKFQIKSEKLSERFYTLTKVSYIDICGIVLDNFAENTVNGATVEILGANNAQITGADGSFYLSKVDRTASIRIRYLGYNLKIIKASDLLKGENCPKILLSPRYEQLDEVIVYKFLTAGIIKETDASFTLNTAEFGILPGMIEPDILQTVQALPGIKSIDETVSDINIRGGTNDQNLVLWNGIKMYQSGHFFGLISAFSPYLTDEVTIYKNGTPAAYGDGVSGVIQMETNNHITQDWSGGAGFNLISGDVYAEVPLSRKLGVQFSARRSTTDFVNSPTYNQFFDRAFQNSEISDQNNRSVDDDIVRDEDFFFYDFSGKLLYDINDNHKLRISAIHIKNDLKYEEQNQTENETSISLLQQSNLSLGTQLMSQWNDHFSSHLNVYYSKYNLDAQNLYGNQVQQLFQNNQVIENALKFDTKLKLKNTLNWNNGYQFIETGITNITVLSEPTFNSDIKGVIRIHAPYTEFDYHSEQNTFIAKIGTRFNFIENLNTFSDFLIEPRVNLNFKIANYLRGEVLGEFKSQTTNQIIDLEQNFLGIEKRRWTLSNGSTLPVTKSKQGSAGINYEKNGFYVGFESFYKEVDGISTKTQGFQNSNQFSGEIGSYKVKGIEFLTNKKGDNYSVWLSYAYNKNDYTFDSIAPPNFPNNLDIRHTITFAGTYDYKDLKLSLGMNYRTGRPYTEPLDGPEGLNNDFFPPQINYKEPNSSRLPEYFRVDVSAIYNFQLTRRLKANAGISVVNITNRKNSLNKYYRVNSDNEIETVENISLGITPNVSFRVSF